MFLLSLKRKNSQIFKGNSCKNFFSSVYVIGTTCFDKKQPFRDVLIKRCSRNMQEIYRRTPMLKCDFNKVAKQVYWNGTLAWVFCCKFAGYFQNNFFQEHLWRAASVRWMFLLYVITRRHYFRCTEVFVTAMLLRFLTQLLWKKSIFYKWSPQ